MKRLGFPLLILALLLLVGGDAAARCGGGGRGGLFSRFRARSTQNTSSSYMSVRTVSRTTQGFHVVPAGGNGNCADGSCGVTQKSRW